MFTRCGHPNTENGNKADENQVSRTSSSGMIINKYLVYHDEIIIIITVKIDKSVVK